MTPRRWGGKEAWQKERRKEGFWRDVRVLDADDLEQWIEQAAAVGTWLARMLGKRTDGLADLRENWEVWSNKMTPPASADLIPFFNIAAV